MDTTTTFYQHGYLITRFNMLTQVNKHTFTPSMIAKERRRFLSSDMVLYRASSRPLVHVLPCLPDIGTT